MIWGETGTRYTATRYQVASTAWLWAKYGIGRLHDGDCVGADMQLYYVALSLKTDITIHPPLVNTYRAWCGGGDINTTILPPKGYFARDRDVVDDSEVMVALPKQPFEPDKSWEKGNGGTWYTINYARDEEKPLAIVWPNGHISYERWNLEAL